MNYIKTFFMLIILSAILMWIGSLFGGPRGVMIAFVLAMLINGVSYWYSDRIVLAIYRAKELDRDKHYHLYQTVDLLSKRAGIPCPRIYAANIDTPNAFATGRDPQNGVLCLTKGAMNLLTGEELEGVISHELAHIRNRDTLIMTVTAALASAIMMIANMARWTALFGGISRDRRDSGNVLGLVAVSIVAPLAALLVQLAISRSREYAADASGAGIAGSGLGLANALEKLAEHSRKTKFAPLPQTQHLFIVQPPAGSFITTLFSTHPPITERVKRLKGIA